MRSKRLYHSIRLLMLRKPLKRADYIREHHLLGGIGENCKWGPWLLPIYPELIIIHDNVHVHKSARIVTHDLLNRFLKVCKPEEDFGYDERLGCVEIMDNVYISMNVVIMPNVRIGANTIVSAGSVVTSDIPPNSIASGNPAKPTGRFDIFMAMRKMARKQDEPVKNQDISDKIVEREWNIFRQRHDKE